MDGLIKNLQSFNSKERFYLIGQILGNPNFSLSKKFRNELGNKLNLQIPDQVFAAMDYHLDWVYASIKISGKNTNGPFPNPDKFIKAQQEDIDFLIAFDQNQTTHLILIEAKGVTGWSNKQMESKAIRLKDNFGKDGNEQDGVIPYFVLMSPYKPQKIVSEKFPSWMIPGGKFNWIKLTLPEKKELKSVTRCDSMGNPKISGDHWIVKPR
jgi:hypothetical protein